jgi:hypothetical protein
VKDPELKVGRAKEPPKRKGQWLRKCRGQQQRWIVYWEVPFAAKFGVSPLIFILCALTGFFRRDVDTRAPQEGGCLEWPNALRFLRDKTRREVRFGGLRGHKGRNAGGGDVPPHFEVADCSVSQSLSETNNVLTCNAGSG